MRDARGTRPWLPAIAGVLLCALILLIVASQAMPATRALAASSSSTAGAPPPKPYTGPPIDTSNASRCDFLDPAVCLQPWPNDYFTVADPSTDTGRRLNLQAASMPANKAGIHIDPTDYNRADGFSPGNMIVVRIPGLDNPQAFRNTGAVSVDHMETYSAADQPVVVINADTGRRQPIW